MSQFWVAVVIAVGALTWVVGILSFLILLKVF